MPGVHAVRRLAYIPGPTGEGRPLPWPPPWAHSKHTFSLSSSLMLLDSRAGRWHLCASCSPSSVCSPSPRRRPRRCAWVLWRSLVIGDEEHWFVVAVRSGGPSMLIRALAAITLTILMGGCESAPAYVYSRPGATLEQMAH